MFAKLLMMTTAESRILPSIKAINVVANILVFDAVSPPYTSNNVIARLHDFVQDDIIEPSVYGLGPIMNLLNFKVVPAGFVGFAISSSSK